MAKTPMNAGPAYLEALARYERLVATAPGVKRKGAANPYTAVNGNMSSYLHPRGAVALRLPPEGREAFLARFGTTLFEAYGVVQKEYVTVPDDLLGDTDALAPYFRSSLDYVASLKPKAARDKGCAGV
jgi:hypothetical protein